MNPRVKKVHPLKNYQLHLTFTNGEEKIFDVKPYLDKGLFKELKDLALFNTVRLFLGSILWANNTDLCPDTLYLESKKFYADAMKEKKERPAMLAENAETYLKQSAKKVRRKK